MDFYNFKKIALRNDKYLRSLNKVNFEEEIKIECAELEDIKYEDVPIHDLVENKNESETEFKIEYEYTEENDSQDFQSDDELLSVIKIIKDEDAKKEPTKKGYCLII